MSTSSEECLSYVVSLGVLGMAAGTALQHECHVAARRTKGRGHNNRACCTLWPAHGGRWCRLGTRLKLALAGLFIVLAAPVLRAVLDFPICVWLKSEIRCCERTAIFLFFINTECV